MKARTNASQRRLVLGLVVGLLVASAWGAASLVRQEPVRFTALFDSTIGLYPGSEVQMLGVPVGTVTAVEPDGPHVRVSMELDPDHAVEADTGAVVIAPTMVSDRFVQLTSPWVEGDGEQLESGAEIGPERTAVPVEIDDIYGSVQEMVEAMGPRGANRNGALSELLETGAENLDGQGESMGVMFREFGKASATLSGIDENFFATIENLDDLNKMLVANDDAVGTVNQQFADVAGYLAQDRDEIGRAAKNLSAAMAILDDFIRDNREHLKKSVDNLVPTARTLKEQRKSLEEMIRIAPLALHNLLEIYDPRRNLLVGRGNVNEVTLWTVDGLNARSSADAPPTLVPGAGSDQEAGR
jgi:phospholipid/cholesterol/gamma-HCH transport system substrate-binding protein